MDLCVAMTAWTLAISNPLTPALKPAPPRMDQGAIENPRQKGRFGHHEWTTESIQSLRQHNNTTLVDRTGIYGLHMVKVRLKSDKTREDVHVGQRGDSFLPTLGGARKRRRSKRRTTRRLCYALRLSRPWQITKIVLADLNHVKADTCAHDVVLDADDEIDASSTAQTVYGRILAVSHEVADLTEGVDILHILSNSFDRSEIATQLNLSASSLLGDCFEHVEAERLCWIQNLGDVIISAL